MTDLVARIRAINAGPVAEALAQLPPAMDSQRARVQLAAIGLQESRLEFRAQILTGGGVGPARGLWQFERGGGTGGVMRHHASAAHARRICEWRGVPFEPRAVWQRFETDDVLAAAFARLLLWTDPYPLSAIGETAAAWDLYTRTWRPGKPHPRTWPAFYAAACKELAP